MHLRRVPDIEHQAMLEPEPLKGPAKHLVMGRLRRLLEREPRMPIAAPFPELALRPQSEQMRKPLFEPGPPHLERFAGGAAGLRTEQPCRVIATRHGRADWCGAQILLRDEGDPADVRDAPYVSRPDAVAVEQLAIEGDVLVGMRDDRPQALVPERIDPRPVRPPVRAKRLRCSPHVAKRAQCSHARSAEGLPFWRSRPLTKVRRRDGPAGAF